MLEPRSAFTSQPDTPYPRPAYAWYVLAILTLAGVPYRHWLRFCLPLCVALMLLGFLALSAGISLNLL